MIRLLVICMLPMISGCAAVTEDPWHWMDDPAMQRWVGIRAQVQGREVRFSVPDRSQGNSRRTRSNLPLAKGEEPIRIDVPTKTEYMGTRVATFNWDYWWGGFFRESGVDFFLSVQVLYYEDGFGFLSMTPDEWIRWQRGRLQKGYEKSGSTWSRNHFFENYQVEIYESATSLNWVQENNPKVQSRALDFSTPIGDKHILYFGFFVDEESRIGMEPDLEWAERRWDMARKILDTVEITPRPGKF